MHCSRAQSVYVQRQMGHASVSTTVDLYGSGLPLEDRHGVDALVPGEAGGGTMVAQTVSRAAAEAAGMTQGCEFAEWAAQGSNLQTR